MVPHRRVQDSSNLPAASVHTAILRLQDEFIHDPGCSGSATIHVVYSVEELESLPAGTKPRASHYGSPGGERRGKG